MPEIINDIKIFTLLEVTLSIQRTIADRYKSAFWVKAEMNKLNHYTHSGHCYPELLEKKGGKIIAQIRSNLWKSDYVAINQKFMQVLKEPLKDGINILFCATIHADPVYGLNLRIIDIDPAFTLGELEREKQQTIERLIKENIFNKNKTLSIPLLPQRIAIISVETSKGYADFLKVINENAWGYKFFYMLFPALLQGDKSIGAILGQMRTIKKVIHHFDVVAIIRGGGGDVGLSSFNNYQLAREIAMFPIPVITGIGHATNETVSEMVSYRSAITPTELADFLLQKFHNFSVPLQKAREKIISNTLQVIKDEKEQLFNTTRYFRMATISVLTKNKHILAQRSQSMLTHSKFNMLSFKESLNQIKLTLIKTTLSTFGSHHTSLIHIEKNIDMLDPVNVLKRGYSITRLNGKSVTNTNAVKASDLLTTTLADGMIESKVLTIQNTNER
ncbi:MAG: exodeoxyribonuclease VII large subunit [Bacteroidia bacterium]|nr:exodeoxyribonuclease VII large subunit [Bacteroidia bacterium]